MRTLHPERRTPTFRQFAMVMAAVTWFAVLLPVGARAAGSLVTLVDPQTSTKARVEETGSLRVADFNEPSRLPVRRDRFVSVTSGTLGTTETLTTVPTGFELVIDTVSVQGDMPTGQQPINVAVYYHNMVNGRFFVPVSFMGSWSNRDYYQGAQGVQLYVDPEHTVQVAFQRSATAGQANATFAISGHLVKL
jgi:hypothetical protein